MVTEGVVAGPGLVGAVPAMGQTVVVVVGNCMSFFPGMRLPGC